MTRKEIELFVEKKFPLDGEAYLRVFHDQIEDALVQIHDAALEEAVTAVAGTSVWDHTTFSLASNAINRLKIAFKE